MEQNDLLHLINKRLNNDDLVLPTLPDIALEINEKMSEDDVKVADIVKLIKKDPAIAASVIRYSNTVVVRGNVEVRTIEQAAVRIGLQKLRNVIMSFAVQQMFFAKDVVIAIDLFTSWKQASDAAIYSCATLVYLQQKGIAKKLDQDVIFLTALVHNLGFLPVLTEADNLGRTVDKMFFDKEFVSNIAMSTGIQLTKRILESWKFDQEIIVPAYRWPEEKYVEKGITYIDILRLGLTQTDSICDELKERFIESYIKKKMIEDKDWTQSEEFIKALKDCKELF